MLKFSLFLLAASCFANPITVGPIGLTGYGEWGWSLTERNTEIFATGTNGVDTVALHLMVSFSDQFAPGSIQGPSFKLLDDTQAFITINGIIGKYFAFSLIPSGPSWLEVYDSYSVLLARADVFYYMNITSVNALYNPNGTVQLSSGTFAVSPVPEPSTLLLSFAGLGATAALRRRSPAAADPGDSQ